MKIERYYDYNKIVDFIIQHKKDNDGISPSHKEIQEECDISSKSVVSYILSVLEQEGKITRKSRLSRAIMIPGGRWIPPEEQVT